MAWTRNNIRRRRNADIYGYLHSKTLLVALYHLTFPINLQSLCTAFAVPWTILATFPSTYFAISTCAVSWLHGRRTSAVVSRAEATFRALTKQAELIPGLAELAELSRSSCRCQYRRRKEPQNTTAVLLLARMECKLFLGGA